MTATLCFLSCRADILLSLVVPTPEQFGVRNMKKHTWAIIKKILHCTEVCKKNIFGTAYFDFIYHGQKTEIFEFKIAINFASIFEFSVNFELFASGL